MRPLSPSLFGLHNRGMSVERHVYFFGNGRADGSAAMRDILGGKGAGLAEMANLGLPVPPGFTLSAKLCIAYVEQGTFPPALRGEVDRHLKHLERVTEKGFGDAQNPLLVSVRSGAAVSMPGMMETIEPWLERSDRRRTDRRFEEPALRLRFLSPLRADVRRCRVRSGQGALRGGARESQGP